MTVSIAGLPKARSNDVVYQYIKEPWYVTPKIPMLVFMLNVLNYINASWPVCKMYLREKKESYVQKSDFPFSFLSLFTILAIEHKISTDQIKIFLIKIILRWRNIKIFSSLHNICLGKVAEKSFNTSIFDLFQFIFTHALLMLASVLTYIRKNVHKFWHVHFFKKSYFFVTH